MLRLNLSAVLLLVAMAPSPAALAAPPPSPSPTPASPAVADHVKRGDVARAARRWADAATAYKAALETAESERLPREASAAIAGELGMCELALGRYRDAAEHLDRALEQRKAITREQFWRFHHGLFNKAYDKVARLIIAVDPPDAELIVDGKPLGWRALSFMLYLEPGNHSVRARLDGYYDDEQVFHISPGGLASTGIKLREVPRPVAPDNTKTAASAGTTIAKPVSPIALPGAGDRDGPDTATRKDDLDQTIGSVSLVPMISFGLTPSVGPGGALDATFHWHRLSVGADLRFFASETTDSVSAVRTLMGRSHVSVCGHRSLFSICGVAGLGRLYAIKDPTIDIIETEDPWSGSLGIRSAVEWQISEVAALRGFAEIHTILGQATVWVDGNKMWTAPPVAGVVGVGLMVPFGHRGSDEKNAARIDVSRVY